MQPAAPVTNERAASNRLLSSSRPLPYLRVDHCEGSWIVCKDGRRVLDASSGLICANVGHRSERVKQRMLEQMDSYAFGGPAVVYPERQIELIEDLTNMVGRPEDSVALTTSGTIAVEIAMGLARNAARVRGQSSRNLILTADPSYHGNSAMALAIAGNQVRRPRAVDSFGLGPDYGAPYPTGHEAQQHPGTRCTAECASAVAEAIDRHGQENVAALLIEPINGTTGGAYVPPDGYLARVAAICRERGVIVIHDEVLTGLWRTAKPLASDHWPDASPDICILSKGLGGGYTSVGAVLVSPEIARLLAEPHADPLPAMGTSAASPLQAAACLGVLEDLRAIGIDSIGKRSTYLSNAVRTLEDEPNVIEVRGRGFLWAVDVDPSALWPLIQYSDEHGILLYPFSGTGKPRSAGVMISPPLNTTEEEIDYIVSTLREGLRNFEIE